VLYRRWGVPWTAYLPEMHDVMDVLWQPMYRDILVQQILPLAPGLVEKLENGTRVADVACGSGNGTLVLAPVPELELGRL
jgi:ubiquinone/menaquinone biosynthesis C-methylase UbiE